jgi:hypothetical protein
MKHFNLKKLLNSISYPPQLNLICQMFSDEEKKNIPVGKYVYNIANKFYVLLENEYAKTVIGPDYNYIFLKQDMFGLTTGYFQRWGKTIEDNPNFAPIGPEILDIEISVNGCPPVGKGGCCKFCYKNNTNLPPTNMTFDTFKNIIDKFPRVLTQIAFGITGVQTNPDFLKMMHYTRSLGIIPNFTLSGADLNDSLADEISKTAGALAVSAYSTDKNVCYDTVKKFTDRGMQQTNIHIMVSQETLPFVYEVLADRLNDPRLEKMHAIVFLGVKPKGRAKGHFKSLSKDQYGELVKKSLDSGINFGFDSCSCQKYFNAINQMNLDDTALSAMTECGEPCESSCMSTYINATGEYWHCSFTENEPNQTYIDVIKAKDFINDVWYSDSVRKFRSDSIAADRQCTVFPEINE